MDTHDTQQLRYYLATPHIERTAVELEPLLFKARMLVDRLQQQIEALAPTPDPDEEPKEKTKPAKTAKH